MKPMRLSGRRPCGSIVPLLSGLLLVTPFSVLAQRSAPNPLSPPASFQHFAYSSNNGAPPDVEAVAQGPNGDLWLASTTGLFLFDGLQFQRFQPAGKDRLRSDLAYSMFIDSRGRAWMGYYSGGASLVADRRVRSFEEGLPKGPIKGFAEDQQGRIWAVSVKGLSWFDGDRWHVLQAGLRVQDGTPYMMLVARDGNLWIATQSALLFIRPGTLRVEHTDVAVKEAWALAEGPDGRLWLSDEAHGTRPIEPHIGDPPVTRQAGTGLHNLVARRLLFDRSNQLWMPLQGQPGIVRLAHPEAVHTGSAVSERDVTSHYLAKGGLTSDVVGTILGDRHGVVWAGTRLGIDRFSPVGYRLRDEISAVPITGLRAVQSTKGTLAIADEDAINLFARDEHLENTIKAPGSVRSICASRDGKISVAGDFGLSQISNHGLSSVPLPAGLKDPTVINCQIDQSGRIWALTRHDGLFRRQAGRWVQLITQDVLGAASSRMMVLDRLDRLWIGLDHRGLGLFIDGRLRRFGIESGLDIGFVQSVQPLEEGMLLGGEFGIASFDGQRFHSFTARDYPQFSLASGIARDRVGGIWISGSRGITHLSGAEWRQLLASSTGRTGPHHLSAITEMPFYPQLNCCANTILPATSGNLWFLTAQGVALIDPTQAALQPIPPRPTLRMVTSNGKTLAMSGTLTLDKGYPDLTVAYTSDSIADAPQIRFRYRLKRGPNANWVDAGSGRQAAYTSLEDGTYTFELQAQGANGQWNPQTVAVTFVVPPTFLQTPWPKIIALVVALVLIALIYRVRLGYAVEALRKRLEERTRERERIARDLHDTLLQSVQALIFRVEGARQHTAPGSRASSELDASLKQAEDVLDETRRTVYGLRLWDDAPDLEHLLDRTMKRLTLEPNIRAQLHVTGPAVQLNSEVGEEIERIIGEAVTNVLRHSEASEVLISADVGRRGLKICVADNGAGIPTDVLIAGQREGHFGLMGMRERAERLSAKIDISSLVGKGTKVELFVPAIAAFKFERYFYERFFFRHRVRKIHPLE